MVNWYSLSSQLAQMGLSSAARDAASYGARQEQWHKEDMARLNREHREQQARAKVVSALKFAHQEFEQEHWATAAGAFMRVDALVPNQPSIQATIGFASRRAADGTDAKTRALHLATAEQAFREVLKLQPADADATARLAEVLLSSGKIDEGVSMAKKAYAIDSSNPMAKNLVETIAIILQHVK